MDNLVVITNYEVLDLVVLEHYNAYYFSFQNLFNISLLYLIEWIITWRNLLQLILTKFLIYFVHLKQIDSWYIFLLVAEMIEL